MSLLSQVQTGIGRAARHRALSVTMRLHKKWAVAILPALDTLCIAVSFALAYFVRFQRMEAFLKTVVRRVWMNCRNSLMWCWAR